MEIFLIILLVLIGFVFLGISGWFLKIFWYIFKFLFDGCLNCVGCLVVIIIFIVLLLMAF